MIDENALRLAVVTEAYEWLGTRTPYIPNQAVKGAGVDCARLLFECYRKFHLITDTDVGVFQTDWWQHSSQDTYFERMLRHANKVAAAACSPSINARMGDAALCRVAGSRLFNHGGIVTHWPYVIEAVEPRVRLVDVSRDPMWSARDVVILDPFAKRYEHANT